MGYDFQELTAEISRKLMDFRRVAPETGRGFGQLAQAALADNALSHKQKELMAMSIAIAQRCQGCLGFHAKALVKAGCTYQEFTEMLQVAVYMGGGPSMMTAAEALMAFEEFGGKKDTDDNG